MQDRSPRPSTAACAACAVSAIPGRWRFQMEIRCGCKATRTATPTFLAASISGTPAPPGWGNCRTTGGTRSKRAMEGNMIGGCRSNGRPISGTATFPLLLGTTPGPTSPSTTPWPTLLPSATSVTARSWDRPPNRLPTLWTGTIRAEKSPHSKAHLLNEETDFGAEVSWTTFPERLEEHGISWKNYQNELGLPSGLESEQDAWLSNFADNPLEFFTQYRVRFSETHRRFLAGEEKRLARALAASAELKDRETAERDLARIRGECARWRARASFSRLLTRSGYTSTRLHARPTAAPPTTGNCPP